MTAQNIPQSGTQTEEAFSEIIDRLDLAEFPHDPEPLPEVPTAEPFGHQPTAPPRFKRRRNYPLWSILIAAAGGAALFAAAGTPTVGAVAAGVGWFIASAALVTAHCMSVPR